MHVYAHVQLQQSTNLGCQPGMCMGETAPCSDRGIKDWKVTCRSQQYVSPFHYISTLPFCGEAEKTGRGLVSYNPPPGWRWEL